MILNDYFEPYLEIYKIHHHVAEGHLSGFPSECPWFAIHDEAGRVVDVANNGYMYIERDRQTIQKSRVYRCFVSILHILDKNEKNNQTPHWEMDEGFPSSYLCNIHDSASTWTTHLVHSDEIPSFLHQGGVRFL